MLVAYRSHPDETKAMRDAFKAYDVDLNGRVSREEFQNVLKKQGYTDEEVTTSVRSPRPNPNPSPRPGPAPLGKSHALNCFSWGLNRMYLQKVPYSTDARPHGKARHTR